jgi:L-ascorbate metabolism protein UlaG (beta-lactamase superfamily)
MKILFFIFVLFPFQAFSQVTFKWLGITGFALSDHQTTIVFDPAITRPGFLDYLPFKTVQTDTTEVDYWMNRCEVKTVQATFINHAHADHVIDAPYVVKKFGGKLFGSSSVVNIGLGQGLSPEQLEEVKQGDKWIIGNFTIRPYLTPHAPHLLDIMLMDGHIKTPLASPASVWDYLVGDTFSYLIEHPNGTILYQAIAKIHENDPLKNIKADALLLTIVNRSSTESLLEKRILPADPKVIIPLHYDNFFYKMKRQGEIDYFWNVNVNEFKEKMKKKSTSKVLWPKYCEEVSLL